MENLTLYLGHDHREAEATLVAEYSARSYASKPLAVERLDHLDLRRRQFFWRPWRIAEDGTTCDEQDGRPFSTQFAFTRFLTPLIAQSEGREGWALFADADILVLEDIYKILEEADPKKAVMVVPHNYKPAEQIKMDGQIQSQYNRKLWSAVMLFNLNSKKMPSLEAVNNASGSYLHQFGWLENEDLGFLSERWHYVADASPTTEVAKYAEALNQPTPINLIHYTTGIPTMPDRQPTPFDSMWHAHHKSAQQELADRLPNG